MWEDFIHHIYDIYYVIIWVIDNLKDLFSTLMKPLTWILNYGRGFFVGIGSTPEAIDFSFPVVIKNFILAIPYVGSLFAGVAIALGILFFVWLLGKIIHI